MWDYIKSNLTTLSFPVEYKKYPVYFTKTNGKYEILATVANHELITFLNNRDIDGLIARLKQLGPARYDFMNYASQVYEGSDKKIIRIIAEQFMKLYYEKYVDTASMSGDSIKTMRKIHSASSDLFELLNYYIAVLPDSTAYGRIHYNKVFLGNTFNKRMVLAFISYLVDAKTYFKTSGFSADVILNNAFGDKSSTETDKFVLNSDAFEKANPDLQDLYYLLMQHKMGELLEEKNLANDWYESIYQSPGPPIVYSQDKVIPDVSSATDADKQKVYERLNTDLDQDQLNQCLFQFSRMLEIPAFGKKLVWRDATLDILARFFRTESLNLAIVSAFLFNDNSSDIIIKQIEQNQDILDDIAKIPEYDSIDFLQFADISRNRSAQTKFSVINWLIKLHNAGKMTFTSPLFYSLMLDLNDPDKTVDYIEIKNVDIFKKLIFSGDYSKMDSATEYYKWIINNNTECRNTLIAFLSKEMSVPAYSANYIVHLLDAKYVNQPIIDNLKKTFWPKLSSDGLFNTISKYKNNPPLLKGLKEFLDSLPKTDLNYEPHSMIKLAISDSTGVNKIITDILDKGDDVAQTIIKNTGFSINLFNTVFNSLSENSEVVQNFDKVTFVELMKCANSINDPIAVFELGRRVKQYNESYIDTCLPKISNKNAKKSFLDYLIGADIGLVASKEIFRDDVVIKPYEQLNETRIGEILKYNRIMPDKKQLANITSVADINKVVIEFSKKIIDVKATEVETDEEYLERKTVEYDVFNKYRHGNIAPKILREFNVNIKEQSEAFHGYVAENPWVDIIDPVFHGTGSIAASMILRYGFAVIERGDKAVKGRMLGDGIYFSDVLDKVSQYVSDSGYSRGIGNKGYILKMKAALGMKNKDYKSEGVDSNTRGLVSPEWVVFHPEKQLLILKAFEVELVSKEEIDRLKQKHQIREETMVELKSFKEYLREAENTKYNNATTFTFMDGTIPINTTNAVDFEQFDPITFGDHIRLEGSQIGPLVTIEHNGDKSQAFCVRNTAEFMEQPELEQFLTLLQQTNT